ncbi:Cytochrome C oxidase, cbb3-type, subunit III [Nitrosomonas eutropha]|uniref:Cytochrome C oxidase, cbb3-type, subunit III n=1 Tax=Nitrosomonas eutropha TaxID=916 RepID=A0A1I7FA21_9PROT|nr:cytochrome c [Nitrosomonas eutropha]SFU33014.1 Cytochrome C oxidase, cbb3-type, subunit III [Nitrosomonas eutropha]
MKKSGQVASVFFFILTTMLMSNAWSAQEGTLSTGQVWKDGAEIYTKVCAYCHETNVGPQILNRQLPAVYVRAIVRNGNRAMPPFRASEIDDESLEKLTNFISHKTSQH